MDYVYIPKTGLRVSKLCLGTMMFGGQTSEAESLAIMDYAYENGINFFDTADAYHQGKSEYITGLGIKGRRDRIVLATKVFNQMGDDMNSRGLSRRHIISACDASLKRLGTDYIDIYYLHNPDYNTSLEETMQTMDTLVRTGKIRYIGISNFAAWQIADILAICDKRGYTAPIMTQNVYNAITRGIEPELVPFVNAHGLGMAVYNPIAAGLLAGKHKPGAPMENTRFSNQKLYYDRYWSDKNFEAIEKLTAIAGEKGLTILELAMRWCISQKHVTCVITGTSKLPQLEQNIKSIDGGILDSDTLAQCDEVWKGISGTMFAYNR